MGSALADADSTRGPKATIEPDLAKIGIRSSGASAVTVCPPVARLPVQKSIQSLPAGRKRVRRVALWVVTRLISNEGPNINWSEMLRAPASEENSSGSARMSVSPLLVTPQAAE